MGSRGYFRLIAVLLVVVVAASIGFALMMADEGTGNWIYVAAQVLLIAAVVLLVILYQKTIKPLNTLSGGIDLIKEQDFSTRLRPVGQKDADRIIELFNRMSDRLHNEELRIQEQNHFLDPAHRRLPGRGADHGHRPPHRLVQPGIGPDARSPEH